MIEISVHPEVAKALESNRPVVALESTIFSHLGLPSPANHEALERCIAAIRSRGGVPAITAVLDGVARVGIDESEFERILGPARKVAERDLAVAIGSRFSVGATTVSASLALADQVGIAVFATGGIGGVHRGVEQHGDVSADLGALARHRVVTVSAGAKSFLDLPRTLEMLETLGVPVVGYRCKEFPAFTVESSGIPLAVHTDKIEVVARISQARRALGGGMLLCTPVPSEVALDAQRMNAVIERALSAASEKGVSGPGITPIVLAEIAADTAGDAVRANLALAENNARVAAELAGLLADSSR